MPCATNYHHSLAFTSIAVLEASTYLEPLHLPGQFFNIERRRCPADISNVFTEVKDLSDASMQTAAAVVAFFPAKPTGRVRERESRGL